MEDIHSYRKAIDPRCRIGVCSMNNCIFPWCTDEGRSLEETSKVKEAREGFYKAVGVDNVFHGVDLVAGNIQGILGPTISIKKDGKWEQVDRVHSLEIRDDGQRSVRDAGGYAGKEAALVIIDDIIPNEGDDGALAQERRKSRWYGFLDSVSAKALSNFRR